MTLAELDKRGHLVEDMSTGETGNARTQTVREGSGNGRRRWPLLVLLLAVVGVIVIALVLSAGDGGPATGPDDTETTDPVDGVDGDGEEPPRTETLAQFAGSGDDTTDTFAVVGNWEIRWEATGGESFEVELFREDGQSRGVVITDEGEGDGSTFVSEEGTFYLEVTTDSDWTIDIVGAPGT